MVLFFILGLAVSVAAAVKLSAMIEAAPMLVQNAVAIALIVFAAVTFTI